MVALGALRDELLGWLQCAPGPKSESNSRLRCIVSVREVSCLGGYSVRERHCVEMKF